MKRISNPVETIELCAYGCGSIAKFINGAKRLMCCKSSNSCPENKRKNGVGVKKCGRDMKVAYANLTQASKDSMAWAKGLTKETNDGIATRSAVAKGRPGISRPHTEETKRKLSVIRTAWLKIPENRKNYGRHKKSWMELTFESYLSANNITGWDVELHFWNDELSKNYYPDFIFEDKKLIIELDGTQHRNTVVQDGIRDQWFISKGYSVIRIPYAEFKERYFSGKGFLDLMGC